MLSSRTIIFIATMAMLVGEILSYNRQMIGMHRNRFRPVYHASVFDGEECADEQCNRRLSADRTAMFQIPVPADFGASEDSSDMWIEPVTNDLNKRGNGNNDYDFMTLLNDPTLAEMYYSPDKKGRFHDVNLSLCRCEVEWDLEFLGRNRYPNYVTKAICKPSVCLQPSYTCKEKKIKISILKLREKGEFPRKFVPLVPIELRSKYIFEFHNLTVGCECSL
ncbi:uncharacterized protein LOC143911786 [Arctopsyche grandis]|uniref:uncharacterized protein LOC143911786 n=1 Tax=Arctopsyche grandis TaxID=121162 RepID=UPI00406D7A70